MKVYLRTNTAGNNITITQNSNNLPTDSNNPLTIIDTANTTTNELKTTQYEVCADNNLANGDYNITIAYVLQDNLPIPMQTFTSADCQARPVYDAADPDPASTMTMIDTRNDQLYLVRKLKDNKCWMIDDLKLALKPGMALTSDTTNVPASEPKTIDFAWGSFTSGTYDDITNFVKTGYLTRSGTGSSASSNYDAWRQVNPNDSSMSNSTNCISNTGDADNGGISYNTNSKTGCGYLYNYYTATAGSAAQADYSNGKGSGYIAQQSICPSGWKLPSGQNAGGDFGYLDTKYDGTGAYQSGTPAQLATLWLSAGAWQGAFSGSYYSGLYGQGSAGDYWSSSVDLSAYAYYTHFHSSYVSPGAGSNTRLDGYAVRCLVS
ncbi:MAG: fibrobacter succinogenes major paralogous domain-containing protein [Candidatus Nomurabacteria bacterium]|jgi:uncharacterized protein (TIGR02145 family)|nr:fibrobacter succinogenes major paralogous domain-containing protein [Candidatus Nomurabacteria bacterium]